MQMIGDILAAELSHMQPYIRFCSSQINGATLLQTRIDNEPDFKTFLKVRCGEEWMEVRGEGLTGWHLKFVDFKFVSPVKHSICIYK